jgi:hypothetical protein
VTRDRASRVLDRHEVRLAIRARRRADADEHDVRAADGLGRIGGEAEPPRREFLHEALPDTGLEER